MICNAIPEQGRGVGPAMASTRSSVDEIRRRERLQQILQKELEKDALSNKVQNTNQSEAKYRSLMLSAHGSRTEASPKSPVPATISPQSDSGVGEWKVVRSRRRSSKNFNLVSKSLDVPSDENRGPPQYQAEPKLTSQPSANQSTSKWGQESRRIGNTAKLPSKAALALDLSTLHKLENEHVLDMLEPSGLPSRRTVQVINRTSKALSEWAALSAYDQDIYQQQKKALAEKHKTATDRQRAVLDEQKRELEEKRQEVIREREREAQRIAQELQEHKDFERQREIERRRKAEMEKLDRDTHLAMTKAQRQAEVDQHRFEEQEEIRRIQQALEEEKQRDLAKREAQRHHLQQTQLENEAQRAEARRQKLLEGDRDKKLMEEYDALLEAQDRARFQRLKEQQEMIMRRMRMGELTQKQNDEKIKQLDEQIREHERRREQMEREKEEANRRRRQEENVRSLATLQKQKQELRDRIDKEASENRRFQEQAQAEAAQVMAEQALNRNKKREKSLQYRMELERQIRDAAEQHAKDGIFMSPTERTFNSRLLHDALPAYEIKLHSP